MQHQSHRSATAVAGCPVSLGTVAVGAAGLPAPAAINAIVTDLVTPLVRQAARKKNETRHEKAWEKNEKVITTNITKAKAITKDRLRGDRKPLLEAQDILFMKAQEAGASTTAIVTEKNRLRDITNQVDGMDTVAKLKAATTDA